MNGDSLNRVFDIFTDWMIILKGLESEAPNFNTPKPKRGRAWYKTGLAVRKKVA